ncbi:hypothetical protein OZX61_12720 (plasmid) [Acinetobacter sp. ESL0695]|uniref:hypothetical protein n=1 Tax=Acinetobacter sp. ESL0695 TaxID=2983215 RepID=UPI0023F57B9F|nr:hypothetical protein [Acinetobacter sp. ESL0695]WEV50256.1 hypothetical protein OZX61_12720 [Acinetobacter sp. ESL0695]
MNFNEGMTLSQAKRAFDLNRIKSVKVKTVKTANGTSYSIEIMDIIIARPLLNEKSEVKSYASLEEAAQDYFLITNERLAIN